MAPRYRGLAMAPPPLRKRLRWAVMVLACMAGMLGWGDARRGAFDIALNRTVQTGAQLLVVVSSDSGAVQRAEVRVYCPEGERYFEAAAGVSDQRGASLLNSLPVAECWVLVDAPALARGAVLRRLKLGLQHLRLRLGKAETLSVSVVDQALVPVPRASVLVDIPGELPFGALTDAAGNAAFQRLTAGPFRVRVYAQGFEAAEQRQVQNSARLVLSRMAILKVRVKDEKGRAVAAAEIQIGGASLWPVRRAVTNAQGEVNILGLPEGSYELRAQSGSLVGTAFTPSALVKGGESEVELTLREGRFALVEVVEDAPSQEKLGGAEVLLAEEGLSFFPLRGKTEKNGQVRLGPLAAGAVSVSALAEGFVATHALAVPSPFPKVIVVKLVRGATLLGRVVDARGFAVPGASLEIIGNDWMGLPVSETPQTLDFERIHLAWVESGPRTLIPMGELGVMPGPVSPIPTSAQAFGDQGGSVARVQAWVTDDAGRFRAFPVTPGRVFAIARHPEFVDGLSDAVTLAKGGRAEVLITLYAGGELTGRVKDARGFGIAGARLEASATRGTLRRSVWTEVDGSFRFAALPAEVVLTVARPEAPFSPVYRERITVLVNQRQEVEIQLAASRDKVRFRVSGERAEPLRMAQISVASLSSGAPFRKTVFTDDRGVAELDDATGRNVQYVVSAPGYALVRHSELELKAEVAVKLMRGVRVEGEVRGVRGHVPVEHATVSAEVEGVRFSAVTNELGQFVLENVPPQVVRFEVKHADFADFSGQVPVPSVDGLARPFKLAPWVLEAAGRISGRVVDKAQQALSGVRVSLGAVSEFLPLGGLPASVVLTDENGAFELTGAKEGLCEVNVALPGVGRGKVSGVQVSAGKTTLVGDLLLSEPFDAAPVLAPSLAISLAPVAGANGVQVEVALVAVGSEAERAGLRAHDVLLQIDGHRVTDPTQARALLEGPEGTDVSLELLRGSESVRLSALRERVRR